MTPNSMREYLAVHAPELKVVELTEAHTTDYISREVESPACAGCQNPDIARRRPCVDRRYPW